MVYLAAYVYFRLEVLVSSGYYTTLSESLPAFCHRPHNKMLVRNAKKEHARLSSKVPPSLYHLTTLHVLPSFVT